MADAASQARLKALAQYFQNGGREAPVQEAGILNDGRLSAATGMAPRPVQNVPQSALSTVSAPIGQMGAGTIDQMAVQRAKQLQQNNLASQPQPEPDLSGFAPWPGPQAPEAPVARQFPKIQQKMNSGEPISSADIRNTMKGPIEMTPENQKAAGYGTDEEDEEKDKPRGQREKAGTAEGSYGP